MDCFDNIMQDVFKASDEDCYDMNFEDESAWLEDLMNEPLLNDSMLPSDLPLSTDFPIMDTDTSPYIQSEHSYSINNADNLCTLALSDLEHDQELESALMTIVNPNLAMTPEDENVQPNYITSTTDDIEFEPATEVSTSEDMVSSDCVASEPQVLRQSAETSAVTSTPQPTIVLTYQPTTRRIVNRTPTIIVTKSVQPYSTCSARSKLADATKCGTSLRACSQSGEVTVLKPMTFIKTECIQDVGDLSTDQITHGAESNLPPSPPNSDSEGLSPKRETPPSPPQQYRWTDPPVFSILNTPTRSHISPSGRLVLTEEERRTLISEGYPVPTKLPLTKQEENNLKKIQRKIKNKMSAQESRRKKKDYLETLEKKLEVSNHENNILKKQLEALQSDNRSLLSQVNKLQNLANKLKPSVETSTCVMVFALFFAMFTSTFWTPATLSVGRVPSPWSSISGSAISLGAGLDPQLQSSPIIDDYQTPNMKSRTLKSATEEPDDTSQSTLSCRYAFLDWLSRLTCAHEHSLNELNNQQTDKSSVPSVSEPATPGAHRLVNLAVKEDSINSTKHYEGEERSTPVVKTAPELVVYTRNEIANMTNGLRTVAV